MKTLCLAVLADRGEASGYDIRKVLSEGTFSFFCDAGYGSIYPALNQLAERNLVSCREREQDKRPDKKIYSLTPGGRMALMDALRQQPVPDRFRSEFLLLLHFVHLLPAREADRLITDRITFYRNRITEIEAMETDSESPGEAFVKGFGMALTRAALAYLEEHQHELVQVALTGEPTERRGGGGRGGGGGGGGRTAQPPRLAAAAPDLSKH